MSLWMYGLLAAIGYLVYYQLIGRRKGLPPGPFPLPLLGNLLLMNRNDFFAALWKVEQQHGKIFTFWFGTQPMVFMTDYKQIKEYLTGKTADVFVNRPDNFINDAFAGARDAGIINANGAVWREQRRFSLHTLRDFGFGRSVMDSSIREQGDLMISYCKEIMEENDGLVDLKEPVGFAVMNVISKVVLGHTFPKKHPTIKAIVDGLQVFTEGGIKVLLLMTVPWLRFIPLFGHFGYDNIRQVGSNMFGLIEAECREVKKTYNSANEPSSYAEACVKEIQRRKEAGIPIGSFTDFQISRAMGDFWGAGFNTTVATLRLVFFYMLHHPDVQEKVHQELDEYYQDESKLVETEDRLSLPYTQAVVFESQRLGNIVAVNVPHVNVQDITVGDYHFKKGTTFVPNVGSVLMDPKIFPEPYEFKPERFIENGKLKKIDEFVPFSLGKRSCAGESLARAELFFIFTMLMKEFRIKHPRDQRVPYELKAGLNREPIDHQVLLVPKHHD